jgi:competence protein ComEA
VDGPWIDRLRRLGGWLDASPVEVVALCLLLAGSAIAAVVLVRGQAAGGAPVLAPRGNDLAPTQDPITIVVHVTGAVARPGVVKLEEGARVADALRAAGGITVDASTDGLNLARAVVDGEQLVVPRLGEQPDEGLGAGPTTPATAWLPDGRLDLNLATAADLEELPGIGPVLAERIIAWRTQHERFDEVGQLRDVSGIGEKTFQSLSPLVAV